MTAITIFIRFALSCRGKARIASLRRRIFRKAQQGDSRRVPNGRSGDNRLNYRDLSAEDEESPAVRISAALKK
jgi:hypothetical protein